MAWSWGDFLSGAGSGASIGSNFSLAGTIIGGIGGGLLGGFGGKEERKISPYNLNQQYTDAQMQRLLADRNYAQNEMSRYLANATAYGGEANQLANQLVQISRPDAYDANAGMRRFLSQAPQFQGLVAATTGDNVIKSEVDALKRASMRDVAQELSGVPVSSGAFARAAGEGMAGVNAQYGAQRQQAADNLLQTLMGQGQQIAEQGEQARAQNELSIFQELQNQKLRGFQAKTTLADFERGIADMFNQRYGQATAGMTSLSAPQFGEDTYIKQANPMLAGLSSVASAAQGISSSIQSQELMDILKGNAYAPTDSAAGGGNFWNQIFGGSQPIRTGVSPADLGGVSGGMQNYTMPAGMAELLSGPIAQNRVVSAPMNPFRDPRRLNFAY